MKMDNAKTRLVSSIQSNVLALILMEKIMLLVSRVTTFYKKPTSSGNF